MENTKQHAFRPAPRPQFPMQRLVDLKVLFQHQNWRIQEDKEYSLFWKFVNTLSLFTDEQQRFLIDLTYSFRWIPGDKYNEHLLKVLQELRRSVGDKLIYFVPCKPLSDYTKVKSSDYVWYNLRDNTFRYEINFGKYKMASTIEEVSEKKLSCGNAIVVLVDDFIGTGSTALNALVHVKDVHEYLLDYSCVKVLTIVAQEQGIKAIEAAGVDVFYSVLAPMGIKDQDVSAESKDAQYRLMKEIEDQIKVNDDNRFGYMQSEALVSMVRCPNNTFPVYWLIKNKSPYERL